MTAYGHRVHLNSIWIFANEKLHYCYLNVDVTPSINNYIKGLTKADTFSIYIIPLCGRKEQFLWTQRMFLNSIWILFNLKSTILVLECGCYPRY